jgi:hypothetical protein
MIGNVKAYLVLTTVVSLVIGLALYFGMSAEDELIGLKREAGLILISTYYVIGSVSAAILFSYINRRPGLFVRAYMASTTIKFLLFLGLLVGLAFAYREALIFVTLIFFGLYILYTVFEKIFIYKSYQRSTYSEDSSSSK